MKTKNIPYMWLAALGAVACVLGCNSNDPKGCVPVSGKVTYEDGSLIEAEYITITFWPVFPDEKPVPNARPGMATVNVADGTFKSAMTRNPGDGIFQGEHRVAIRADDADSQLLASFPQEYAEGNSTPLVAHTNDSPFNFKIPKR